MAYTWCTISVHTVSQNIYKLLFISEPVLTLLFYTNGDDRMYMPAEGILEEWWKMILSHSVMTYVFVQDMWISIIIWWIMRLRRFWHRTSWYNKTYPSIWRIEILIKIDSFLLIWRRMRSQPCNQKHILLNTWPDTFNPVSVSWSHCYPSWFGL